MTEAPRRSLGDALGRASPSASPRPPEELVLLHRAGVAVAKCLRSVASRFFEDNRDAGRRDQPGSAPARWVG